MRKNFTLIEIIIGLLILGIILTSLIKILNTFYHFNILLKIESNIQKEIAYINNFILKKVYFYEISGVNKIIFSGNNLYILYKSGSDLILEKNGKSFILNKNTNIKDFIFKIITGNMNNYDKIYKTGLFIKISFEPKKYPSNKKPIYHFQNFYNWMKE